MQLVVTSGEVLVACRQTLDVVAEHYFVALVQTRSLLEFDLSFSVTQNRDRLDFVRPAVREVGVAPVAISLVPALCLRQSLLAARESLAYVRVYLPLPLRSKEREEPRLNNTCSFHCETKRETCLPKSLLERDKRDFILENLRRT